MAVTATGFFDGVHTGHRAVIGRLVREASARGEDSVVVAFIFILCQYSVIVFYEVLTFI